MQKEGDWGGGAGTCCRSVASGRCACGEISEITSYITERTHIVIHTQSIKHNDRWLRRRDTLPVPEEKHSHFVFRNVIFCVSPVRIPAVLSGRNRSYRAAVKGDDKNSKSSVCMICFIELQLIGATEKPHKHTHTHTRSYCAPENLPISPTWLVSMVTAEVSNYDPASTGEWIIVTPVLPLSLTHAFMHCLLMFPAFMWVTLWA